MSLNTKYDILDNRLVIRRLNAGDRQCFEACYRFYYILSPYKPLLLTILRSLS